VTQKPILDDDEDDAELGTMPVSQDATPDTVVFTKELTQQNLTEEIKEKTEEEKETQDTVLVQKLDHFFPSSTTLRRNKLVFVPDKYLGKALVEVRPKPTRVEQQPAPHFVGSWPDPSTLG
jgi:hypothetical protein